MTEQAAPPATANAEAIWGLPLTVVHCPDCEEAHLAPTDFLPERCPCCLEQRVTPDPSHGREEPPEQVVPYAISPEEAYDKLTAWSKEILFRPAGMAPSELARRMRPYLIPLWLVDGDTSAHWRADVGFDYQVISSQDRYVDGRGWESQKLREDRVRWEPRVGRLERRYENVPAPAVDDHRDIMARLGPVELRQRRPYSPAALPDQPLIRIPSLPTEAAWPGVEDAFVRQAETDCQIAAGADHIRDFLMDGSYDDLSWTQLLIPAYVTWYEDGRELWPILINGQSGHVDGVRRASVSQATTASLVAGGIAIGMIVVGALLALIGAALPPLLVLGGALIVLGLLLAVVAPAPLIGTWIFNRRSSARSERRRIET